MIKNILIIEDNKELCDELDETLTDLGYDVHLVFDGLLGKKLITKSNYDVIILDLKIPRFDGYKILDFIQKKKIRSKIIVITARMKINFEDIINQDRVEKEDNLLKKASFVIKKPFKTIDLIEKIKKL